MSARGRAAALGLVMLGSVPARAEAPAPERVEGKSWTVSASLGAPVIAGQLARLEVVVEAKASFHLNDDYPIAFTVTPAAGIVFTKPRFDKHDGIVTQACGKDATHRCRAIVPASFAAHAAGRVGGVLAFSACDAEQCLIEKVAVSVPVSPGK